MLIWEHLESLRAIWRYLRQSGSTWCHQEPSRVSWSSPGSTLKRPPALVKHLPQIITPCGHLGHLESCGAIWRSGPSGAIWSRHHILRIRNTLGRTYCLPNVLEACGAIWSHLWQSGAIWGNAVPSGVIQCHPGHLDSLGRLGHLGPSGAI